MQVLVVGMAVVQLMQPLMITGREQAEVGQTFDTVEQHSDRVIVAGGGRVDAVAVALDMLVA